MTSEFVSIPADKADCIRVAGDGGVALALYRLRASRRGGPVLLWGHAGGFAAGSYLPLLEQLADEAEVFAFDARGHGGSAVPAPNGAYHPDHYAEDLARIIDAVATMVGERPIHYGAHSLNAAAMMRLGVRFPERLRRLPVRNLALFEPPLFPTPDVPVFQEAIEKNRALVTRTRVRRRDWSSPDEYAAFLEGRGPFAVFPAALLQAHAQATLRPLAPGRFELACPPEVEAAVFAAFADDETFRLLPNFPATPTLHLISGDPAAGPGRDWVTAAIEYAARRLAQLRFTVLRGRGHLMVFEAPDEALSHVRDLWAKA